MAGSLAGWEQRGSVLAWPRGWQRPARTEEWAWERCLEALPKTPFAQMVCFPWATLIDLQRKGWTGKARSYVEALRMVPPRATLIRATVLQHIYARDMWPFLERLGITDAFWSHAAKGEEAIAGIRVHPFPLYPVCALEGGGEAREWRAPGARRYLYSFIGAYQPGLYLTEARRWILELPRRDDARVELRGQWHFESAVYDEQIAGARRGEAALDAQAAREREYREVMTDSLFSLCPSGSGPNTIRLWEAIGLGSIPVMLSDRCRLPGDEREWREAIVVVPESEAAVRALPAELERLRADAAWLEARQAALRSLWSRYGERPEVFGITRLFAEGPRAVAAGAR